MPVRIILDQVRRKKIKILFFLGFLYAESKSVSNITGFPGVPAFERTGTQIQGLARENLSKKKFKRGKVLTHTKFGKKIFHSFCIFSVLFKLVKSSKKKFPLLKIFLLIFAFPGPVSIINFLFEQNQSYHIFWIRKFFLMKCCILGASLCLFNVQVFLYLYKP